MVQPFNPYPYTTAPTTPANTDTDADTDAGAYADTDTGGVKSGMGGQRISPVVTSTDDPMIARGDTGAARQQLKTLDGSDGPKAGAAYSAILFGPPGTAKTTICEATASYLGWSFVVVDTSAFLADGLGNVAARISFVFDRLCSLEKCVILFDEIEEFCLDRETPGLGMESRMLTTSMLTKINDLRRGRRSLFFVATNRLRAFDSAVTRPGRFDMQLFVGTPNLDARCMRFEQRLGGLGPGRGVGANSEDAKALATFRSFLKDNWQADAGDAMFLNYLKGKSLQLLQCPIGSQVRN
eukprot:FR737291.1.p1 GENE.FR737291.1~~FR737291.1.p1  ORF type:complete len:321 (+),score=17.91 FR737291.1:78-965(+)